MHPEEQEDIQIVREAMDHAARQILTAHRAFNRDEVEKWPAWLVSWIAPAVAEANRASLYTTVVMRRER
jgi:hypothetical protein